MNKSIPNIDSKNGDCNSIGTFHKYRIKFIDDKPVYVCQVCSATKEMQPHITVVSPQMYKILKDLKP